MGEFYVDRRMMKWMAFEALTDQHAKTKRLFDEHKEEKPILSLDQYEMMQYRFEEALHMNEMVTITFITNDKKQQIKGTIDQVYPTEKVLVINHVYIHIKSIIDVC